LKSCPRCNGDLFIQLEIDGWYEECLACGYRKDISDLVTTNALGQVKMKGPIEAEEKMNADV
jgi:DNA-directed RNA polymerase subunit M/transcription elongation factor TFIIS